jgi:hypothetical protein
LYGTKLSLFFSQNYSLHQSSTGDQEWKVRTEGYIYRLDDEEGNEIFSYHPSVMKLRTLAANAAIKKK